MEKEGKLVGAEKELQQALFYAFHVEGQQSFANKLNKIMLKHYTFGNDQQNAQAFAAAFQDGA